MHDNYLINYKRGLGSSKCKTELIRAVDIFGKKVGFLLNRDLWMILRYGITFVVEPQFPI